MRQTTQMEHSLACFVWSWGLVELVVVTEGAEESGALVGCIEEDIVAVAVWSVAGVFASLGTV